MRKGLKLEVGRAGDFGSTNGRPTVVVNQKITRMTVMMGFISLCLRANLGFFPPFVNSCRSQVKNDIVVLYFLLEIIFA